MGDFEEKLESILNNPQAMEQIMSLAQSLGGKESATFPPSSEISQSPSKPEDTLFDAQMLSNVFSLLNQYNSVDDQRAVLLTALRPFLKEQRYAKIDRAIQIAKLSRIIRYALELFRSKEGGNV